MHGFVCVCPQRNTQSNRDTLHYMTQHQTLPHHTLLYHTTPHYTTLHHTTPHHTTPHHTTPHTAAPAGSPSREGLLEVLVEVQSAQVLLVGHPLVDRHLRQTHLASCKLCLSTAIQSNLILYILI